MNGKVATAPAPEASTLSLRNVSRSFGETEAIRDLNLSVAPGEFVAIVGPSGCGKTTLLKLLSGFDAPSGGIIQRNGKTRMVYQQDGLFPWLTVSQNISLGLRNVPVKAARAQELKEMLALIELDRFAAHYPHQLSGGMRQRVEIARALAGEVDILLMDEPFSSLDYITRLRMRQELVKLLHDRPRTVVFVTHDIEEAVQLADRVLVLTERPAQVRFELRLDVPRPRHLTHPQVVDAVRRIFSELGLETDEL